ncbi:MAG: hypothetical protein ACOYI8_06840 [Christensenellales bacterium]|jgi:hypothetical protein
MSRLYVKVIRRQRIERHETIPCGAGEEKEKLAELLREMDIPVPMWLEKHEKEYAQFRRTWFLGEHFIEDVSFDKLEIEFLPDDGVTRRSRDPRNDFGDYA